MRNPKSDWIRLSCWLVLALLPLTALARETPDLLLARVYSGDVDVTRYWVSEKYDGVRAYWDGRHLISRRGNPYHAPQWFIADFPKTPLDGELWMGRGAFEALVSAVRKDRPVDSEWRKIRYMVFELPGGKGDFSSRLTALKNLLATHPSRHIELVKQFRVTSHKALMDRLDRVVRAGGEGLMLHLASAAYHGGRSSDLLKLKPYFDTEACVVAHLPGKGKYQGMLGALLVETPDHKRFRIGTGFTDEQRRNPPPVGATITYRYRGFSRNGIPRFASFLRIRPAVE